MRADVQQQRVLVGALDLAVHPGERVGVVAGDVPVEVGVVLVADLVLGPRPQRRGLVDGLVLVRLGLVGLVCLLRRHQDRQADVVGVLPDDRAQPEPAEQVVLSVPEVQDDRGASGWLLDGLQCVLAPPVGCPADALVRGQARPPGGQLHPVGHDERGVEADAELTDQGRVLPLVAGQRLEELARPRLGDRPDVLDHLGAAHPDPVVRHGDRPRLGVVGDPDPQRPLFLRVLAAGKQFQPQPVDGIGGVRDQLAQEDLLVAVQRVDHQVQELHHLGLEAERLLILRRHRTSHLRPVISRQS